MPQFCGLNSSFPPVHLGFDCSEAFSDGASVNTVNLCECYNAVGCSWLEQNAASCELQVGGSKGISMLHLYFTHCTSSPTSSGWIKVADNVCVDAEDDTGTTFSVNIVGDIEAVRLEHRSGEVTCDHGDSARYSNWGCDPVGQYSDNLALIIFEDEEFTKRAWPTSETQGFTDICTELCDTFRIGDKHWYKIDGFLSEDPYLEFLGPTRFARNQYTIIYSDALKGCITFPRSWCGKQAGTTCFDVKMKFADHTCPNPSVSPTSDPFKPSISYHPPSSSPSVSPLTLTPSVFPTSSTFDPSTLTSGESDSDTSMSTVPFIIAIVSAIALILCVICMWFTRKKSQDKKMGKEMELEPVK